VSDRSLTERSEGIGRAAAAAAKQLNPESRIPNPESRRQPGYKTLAIARQPAYTQRAYCQRLSYSPLDIAVCPRSAPTGFSDPHTARRAGQQTDQAPPAPNVNSYSQRGFSTGTLRVIHQELHHVV